MGKYSLKYTYNSPQRVFFCSIISIFAPKVGKASCIRKYGCSDAGCSKNPGCWENCPSVALAVSLTENFSQISKQNNDAVVNRTERNEKVRHDINRGDNISDYDKRNRYGDQVVFEVHGLGGLVVGVEMENHLGGPDDFLRSFWVVWLLLAVTLMTCSWNIRNRMLVVKGFVGKNLENLRDVL